MIELGRVALGLLCTKYNVLMLYYLNSYHIFRVLYSGIITINLHHTVAWR